MIEIESFEKIEPREAQFSLYLQREVLAETPGGYSATVATDLAIYYVSKLEGEFHWTIDGKALANGLPIFYNGAGARYLRTTELDLAEVVSALEERLEAVEA